jgi:Uncharacterized protein conserved in bacteria
VLTRREIIAAAGLALIAERARAQGGYSDRPIRILVGYPAGGGVDIVARLFAEPMKATLGQSVIVENRAGASAMIAAGAVAKSPPDGLTLLMAASGEVAINQHLYKDKMSYDPLRELAPVALVGIVPCVVVVAAQTAGAHRRRADRLRAGQPRQAFVFLSGIGNPQQLAGELMNSMAGTDVLHVPYRGRRRRSPDVATGAVTMSFSSLAAALPLIRMADCAPSRSRRANACRNCPTSRRWPRPRPSSRPTSSQLVRTVRDRGHAGPHCRAPQRHRHDRAARQGNRREARRFKASCRGS